VSCVCVEEIVRKWASSSLILRAQLHPPPPLPYPLSSVRRASRFNHNTLSISVILLFCFFCAAAPIHKTARLYYILFYSVCLPKKCSRVLIAPSKTVCCCSEIQLILPLRHSRVSRRYPSTKSQNPKVKFYKFHKFSQICKMLARAPENLQKQTEKKAQILRKTKKITSKAIQNCLSKNSRSSLSSRAG